LSPVKQIVVLGGGFAGLHLVRRLERRLRRSEASVTLVDRQNYHLFTPLLYQVCTGELPPHAVAYPLRDATAPAGFQFLQSEVTAIDLERRRVGTADGELPFDHLVIALGSVTNDYGIPGVRENALPVKWLSDAEALKPAHVYDERRRGVAASRIRLFSTAIGSAWSFERASPRSVNVRRSDRLAGTGALPPTLSPSSASPSARASPQSPRPRSA